MTTGTKERFRFWLQTHKHMTYSKYTTLSIDAKLKIQDEYRGKT